jgi:hypothetical protein
MGCRFGICEDRPIQVKDKDKGLIETGWVEMEGQERAYGIFTAKGLGIGNVLV